LCTPLWHTYCTKENLATLVARVVVDAPDRIDTATDTGSELRFFSFSALAVRRDAKRPPTDT
jgi:hypothetical protein